MGNKESPRCSMAPSNGDPVRDEPACGDGGGRVVVIKPVMPVEQRRPVSKRDEEVIRARGLT